MFDQSMMGQFGSAAPQAGGQQDQQAVMELLSGGQQQAQVTDLSEGGIREELSRRLENAIATIESPSTDLPTKLALLAKILKALPEQPPQENVLGNMVATNQQKSASLPERVLSRSTWPNLVPVKKKVVTGFDSVSPQQLEQYIKEAGMEELLPLFGGGGGGGGVAEMLENIPPEQLLAMAMQMDPDTVQQFLSQYDPAQLAATYQMATGGQGYDGMAELGTMLQQMPPEQLAAVIERMPPEWIAWLSKGNMGGLGMPKPTNVESRPLWKRVGKIITPEYYPWDPRSWIEPFKDTAEEIGYAFRGAPDGSEAGWWPWLRGGFERLVGWEGMSSEDETAKLLWDLQQKAQKEMEERMRGTPAALTGDPIHDYDEVVKQRGMIEENLDKAYEKARMARVQELINQGYRYGWDPDGPEGPLRSLEEELAYREQQAWNKFQEKYKDYLPEKQYEDAMSYFDAPDLGPKYDAQGRLIGSPEGETWLKYRAHMEWSQRNADLMRHFIEDYGMSPQQAASAAAAYSRYQMSHPEELALQQPQQQQQAKPYYSPPSAYPSMTQRANQELMRQYNAPAHIPPPQRQMPPAPAPAPQPAPVPAPQPSPGGRGSMPPGSQLARNSRGMARPQPQPQPQPQPPSRPVGRGGQQYA